MALPRGQMMPRRARHSVRLYWVIDVSNDQLAPMSAGSSVQNKPVQFEADESAYDARLEGDGVEELSYDDETDRDEETLDDQMDDEPTMARASALRLKPDPCRIALWIQLQR